MSEIPNVAVPRIANAALSAALAILESLVDRGVLTKEDARAIMAKADAGVGYSSAQGAPQMRDYLAAEAQRYREA